jgi:hypothetical protein
MQVVINISEKDYQTLKKKEEFDAMYLNYYEKLIVYGTPLPKGHGRLIDADALNFNADYNEPLISKFDFDQAPTIIEADREV